MNVRSVAVALASGIAAFFLVGIAVTAFAEQWIEFSLLVGIPAGLTAGALAAAGVAYGLAEGAPTERRRLAISFAGFGVTFLVILLVAAGLFHLPLTLSISVGTVGGLIAAAGAYVRRLKVPPPA